mgnify:CR=1 FL=1
MHALSSSDREFVRAFESLELDPAQFDHRAHVRLAYAYLVDRDPDAAASSMRASLNAFIRHNAGDPAKYHETITRAWILAVRHFMSRSPGAASADAFIDANPTLLDRSIMLTHYSAEVLFSEEARRRWVEPDMEAIP